MCVGVGVLDAGKYGVLFAGNERASEARERRNQSADIFAARETFGKAYGSAGKNPETRRGGGQLLSCLPAVRRKAGIAGVTRFRTKEG